MMIPRKSASLELYQSIYRALVLKQCQQYLQWQDIRGFLSMLNITNIEIGLYSHLV